MATIDHYIEFDLDYDKEGLLKLYNDHIDEFPALRNLTSPFRSVSEDISLSEHDCVKHVFDELFVIPNSTKFYSLTSLEKRTIPHTNPGCNGNIIIPLCGKGERFINGGYTVPKPLIKIFDKPMIEYVIDNIKLTEDDIVFIIYNYGLDNYDFSSIINNKYKNIHLIKINLLQ
jgi:hypothetical protein